ncbi:MAG: hypothetical protein PHE27_03280 [Alphaproteobacteria bacterium]|nr:hypothetical protein [Alphaproteobacteria bacterium]
MQNSGKTSGGNQSSLVFSSPFAEDMVFLRNETNIDRNTAFHLANLRNLLAIEWKTEQPGVVTTLGKIVCKRNLADADSLLSSVLEKNVSSEKDLKAVSERLSSIFFLAETSGQKNALVQRLHELNAPELNEKADEYKNRKMVELIPANIRLHWLPTEYTGFTKAEQQKLMHSIDEKSRSVTEDDSIGRIFERAICEKNLFEAHILLSSILEKKVSPEKDIQAISERAEILFFLAEANGKKDALVQGLYELNDPELNKKADKFKNKDCLKEEFIGLTASQQENLARSINNVRQKVTNMRENPVRPQNTDTAQAPGYGFGAGK